MLNVDALKTKAFTKGAVVFKKGEPAEFAYLIRSGVVMIVGERDGQEIILDTLYRGDFFGEMALVDDEPTLSDGHCRRGYDLYRILEG